jgi:hypothetical protein
MGGNQFENHENNLMVNDQYFLNDKGKEHRLERRPSNKNIVP